MSRFVSRCCNCSFAYNITCPQLKVPIQPEITGCAAASCAAVLPCLYLNQCGNAIWAFGDGLAAVNGIVTGTDSALDATCTHACCFTRTCPCIQYNLCNCCEVYANTGTYYHRIRYVTDSFEVSDFSDAGCFCIKQARYCTCACGLCRNNETIGINTCGVTGTVGVNNCVKFQASFDSDFSTILQETNCTGSCVTANENFNATLDVNPDSAGEYLSAGTTIYTRTITYGGYTCSEICCSDPSTAIICGDLFVFALCDAVGASSGTEGCNCIQLYATYTNIYNFCNLSSFDTCYKFEVSPFCDFCSDVVTCCGCYNIYIPKTSLGGSGACSDYFVRVCLLDSSTAPTVAACAKVGNVTYVAPGDSCAPYCGDGSLCFYACTGTINWNGPIVAFGIGSGGPGSTFVPGPICCSGCSNSCVCTRHYCCIWGRMDGGSSGCMGLAKLENEAGVLNGCTFCLYASDANWGSFRCSSCQIRINSFFCIDGVCCVPTDDIAGLAGGGAINVGCYCFPFRCYAVSAPMGASGNVKLDPELPSTCSTGVVYFCCCNVNYDDCTETPHACYDPCVRHGNRMISYCCCSSSIGTDGTGCSYVVQCFTDPPACDICACACFRNFHGLNLYGLGGVGALWAVNNNICCNITNVCIYCGPCRGYGFGAGGPAIFGDHSSSCWAQQVQGTYDCGTGCRYFCGAHSSSGVWQGCLGYMHSCNGRMMKLGGGGGGMMFMCNHPTAMCAECIWKGRPGIMMIACQGFE